MFYGLLLQVLFVGLGLHYVLKSEASALSKTIIGGLVATVLLFGRWMPGALSLSIQFLMSGYIIMYNRLQVVSSDQAKM
jgi:hypothetical protein